ncbi:bifunctional phosphopantothenoylcysteine decarboxylase/phosphopantothenate--cysteine ligase CoaBC [Fervidobacterium pennivorans subsp. shakshaketiis]|jgi:phosphopantothenoylcysteine decarboxylase/phosphopantothenate--cysteine ligase|uniref:Coenzyme A biosynthesis bifunctional protein CoaBC n=1 Tax=Fervidobacterium pennivorans (strain DSM 9078 / Ven5) TaxID=771875 RepID=H9UDH5_FERPD|nr:bifunctional phosphopantothenoylcysteine decarboxylase/phosphopantothenate--cysteine ligase CoaBC [Fervidobacterium pennivorans]AFG35568.1 phosphopantothenoylcysteine decarboxylase/phosphopantothenate--cysteine ligase [Fervidobacterium pennivorans DSM 9078]QIV78805.1 bifunctional phosphopantothenoylcysteine decarboxylase/phosphopantothenate--cysteine ligase CoaBC [Fervidobacterium pennivorans subsp. keratinolyticus]
MNILLGVSSGIAIYKAVDLASKIRKEGWNLKVIMTENATKLISPIVFSSVGNCEVFTDTYEIERGWIIHTEVSKWADVLLIAPATANTIAKLAHGFADNLLTTTALAFNKPNKVIVPTMNSRMYENDMTVENIEKLKQHGWKIVEPEAGHLACGEVGKGRYPENEKIIEFIRILTEEKPLLGKKVLITAGPTREAIDPVRYISNHSSGKMGYAIAKIAKRLGAQVCLVSGPTCLQIPYYTDSYVSVESAKEMFEAVLEKYKEYDILIMCAAVADYSPTQSAQEKIKKTQDKLILELSKNPDILEFVGKNKLPGQVVVGFAAETQNIVENAYEKLMKKNADVIVANDARKAMGSDENQVYLVFRDKPTIMVEGKKEEVAKELLKRVCELL